MAIGDQSTGKWGQCSQNFVSVERDCPHQSHTLYGPAFSTSKRTISSLCLISNMTQIQWRSLISVQNSKCTGFLMLGPKKSCSHKLTPTVTSELPIKMCSTDTHSTPQAQIYGRNHQLLITKSQSGLFASVRIWFPVSTWKSSLAYVSLLLLSLRRQWWQPSWNFHTAPQHYIKHLCHSLVTP